MPFELGGYQYPDWAKIVGFCLTSISVLCIPLYAGYKLIITPGSFRVVSGNNNLPQIPHTSLPQRLSKTLRPEMVLEMPRSGSRLEGDFGPNASTKHMLEEQL